MKQITVKQKGILKVPNIDKCSIISGIEVVGKKLYVSKSDHDYNITTIMEYQDYQKQKYKIYRYTGKLGHANGLAYHNKKLVIAPCGYYLSVLDMAQKGKRVQLVSPVRISGVTHYKDDRYIILASHKNERCRFYEIIVKDKIIETNTFVVENVKYPNDFTVTQDIGFHNGNIYMVVCTTNKKKSAVLRIPYQGESGVLKPDLVYLGSENGGEYESVSFTKEGEIVVSSNTAKGDWIYKIC